MACGDGTDFFIPEELVGDVADRSHAVANAGTDCFEINTMIDGEDQHTLQPVVPAGKK